MIGVGDKHGANCYRRYVRVIRVTMDDLKVVLPPQERPDPKKQQRQSASVHGQNPPVLTGRGRKLQSKVSRPRAEVHYTSMSSEISALL
jgi:hypothetical protein